MSTDGDKDRTPPAELTEQTNGHAVTIEYDVQLVPKGEKLTVYAQEIAQVRVLDVTEVGPDLQYRYVVLWGAERNA